MNSGRMGPFAMTGWWPRMIHVATNIILCFDPISCSKESGLTSSAPLNGTVVIEIGHSVSAPFAGLVLAQLGADVIKVEHPEGGDHARRWGPPLQDGASALFHAFNRDKRSVALDLRDSRARNTLMQFIVERADVVIQNL